MKFTLTVLSLLLVCSCELHDQTNITGKKVEAKIVNLSVIEKISSAIVQNDVESVISILASGEFEVNIPNKSGELILNKAIKSNRFIIGSLLLESGAKPDSVDELGHTGMSLAEASTFSNDWKNLFSGEKLTRVTAGLQVFANLESANASSERKFLPLIGGLMKLGAPIDGVNEGSFTYLMVASSKNLLGIVEHFCQYPEIDPNVTVERGRGRRKKTFSALILATTEEMRSLLKKCGAVQ